MFIEILIIGIIVGGYRSGRLTNITDMNIRGWYLIILSLLLSLIPVFLNGVEALADIQVYMLFVSMLLVLLVVLLNLDKKGVWLILIGGLFNIGIMVFNGFKMPVVMSTLESAGLTTLFEGITDGSIVNYIAAETSGMMTVFTKFIPIPKPYPFPKILTLGDILMTLGIFMMIIGEMSRPSYFGKGKMVKYSYGSTFKRR